MQLEHKYNTLNQLTESAAHLYTYDPDGNLTSETNKSTGEQKIFLYSSDNRLLRFEHIPPGQTTPSTIRHYDTFGNLLSQSGPTKTNLGFQSKYFDQESGLNYFYHRYYNTMIGRFTTEDPMILTD